MEPVNKTVVRVYRNAWWDGRKLRCETALSVLKRECSGVNLLREEAENIGGDEVALRISNLHTVPPGVYEMVFSYTGGGEDAELDSATLIPFQKGLK